MSISSGQFEEMNYSFISSEKNEKVEENANNKKESDINNK